MKPYTSHNTEIVPLQLLGHTIVLIQPTQTSHIPHCWMCSALDEGEGCSSKQKCIHKLYWQSYPTLSKKKKVILTAYNLQHIHTHTHTTSIYLLKIWTLINEKSWENIFWTRTGGTWNKVDHKFMMHQNSTNRIMIYFVVKSNSLQNFLLMYKEGHQGSQWFCAKD